LIRFSTGIACIGRIILKVDQGFKFFPGKGSSYRQSRRRCQTLLKPG
jgi:hypothetical protein